MRVQAALKQTQSWQHYSTRYSATAATRNLPSKLRQQSSILTQCAQLHHLHPQKTATTLQNPLSRPLSFLHPIQPSHNPSSQFRHSSSSSPSSSSTASATRIHFNPKINPPPTTLPPILVTPTRQPSQSAPSYYYSLGRAYLTFYKTGVRAIWTNHKASRAIMRALAQGRAPSSAPASTYGRAASPHEQEHEHQQQRRNSKSHNSDDKSNSANSANDSSSGSPAAKKRSYTPSTALHAGLLTRAEYQLLRRSRRDIAKIPLFALILAVCGEFTPLVVLFLGLNGVVPVTCRVPAQERKVLEQAEERRTASFRAGTTVDDDGPVVGKGADGTMDEVLRGLDRPILLHIGRSLGLYSGVWDRLESALGGSVGIPTGVLRKRVGYTLSYLADDDAGIRKFGGVDALSADEARIASEERGLDTLGKGEDEVRRCLGKWLALTREREREREREKQQTAVSLRLLLRRPNAWG
ncbi:hypothetical protein MMC25_003721 [Agyrium rufum]|nr:hypothetical protein [Agyrium rufum]